MIAKLSKCEQGIESTLVPSVRTDIRISAKPKYVFLSIAARLLWLPAELNFKKFNQNLK